MKIYDETLQQYVEVSIKALDSMPIGSIIAFAGSSIPAGWLLCDGSTITSIDYPELYDLVGGTLPNYKGRTLVGRDANDTDFDTIGETGGEKTHTLTTNEMPTHNHAPSISIDGNDVYWGGSGNKLNLQSTGIQWTSGTNGSTISTSSTGGGQPHNNLQPYAVVNWIIKAKNTVPTMASVLNESSDSTTDTYSCDFINNMQVQAEPEIAVQSTTPTGEECLWINPEEYPDGNLNPITNTYSVAEDKGYSCDYINKLSTYPSTSAGEIIIGQTTDGTPVYRKTIYITQQNQPHGISNLFAVISTNAILNNFDYGWNNVSYDVIVQSSNVWLRDRALNNVSNGILLTIEYYKTTD